jgi:BirA family biotin operon repressor/biotin-[acetyl-CoA-carboxylase] ligase
LLEVVAEAHGPSMVVLGLGLNTRLRGEQIEAIDQPWVDLDEILGPGRYSRNRLAAALTDALTAALEQYGQAGLVPFLSRWERYDLYRGEIVGIHIGDRVVFGVQAGITDQGGLRVDVDGTVETFQAGEVSLRDPNQSAVS